MSINHAILGLLSVRPLSGYDLKKIIQESSFMHWSGNNNQIYKALLELGSQGYVVNEVHYQEKSPSKKIYTITKDGIDELRCWLRQPPEAPEYKNPFLVRLAWADLLDKGELMKLLDQYELEIRGLLAGEEQRLERAGFAPDRSVRETVLWDLIQQNTIASYSRELQWIKEVKQRLAGIPDEKAEDEGGQIKERMEKDLNYQIAERNKGQYIRIEGQGRQISCEQDGLDIIAVCAQNDIRDVYIDGGRLSDDFLRLSTGVAGAILQKFINYGIRVVVVLEEARVKGRFKEFMAEINSGSMFRVYPDSGQAVEWLLGQADLKG